MDITTLTEEVEKVSLIYTDKFGITRDTDWFILKLQEELGELIQSYLMMIGQARKKEKSQDELVQDFKKEVADVFSHVLLLAKHHDIDLEAEVKDKWLIWNKS
jgi:NTP pyrophosphatase (non-canonical NTP hydrolase)